MAKKNKSLYICQNCGTQHPKWQGQCSGCMGWNTLVEELQSEVSTSKAQQRWDVGSSSSESQPIRLNELTENDKGIAERIPSSIKEWDRVLGGGLTKGSYTLLGGDPGIGKSTLALQLALSLKESGLEVLYISGEESSAQIALRSKRLSSKPSNLLIYNESHIEKILSLLEKQKTDLIVIDSIQTLFSSELQSAPGTVAQVRECALKLLSIAKKQKTSVILIGHVTKEGTIAGPRVLEHMVDTVLSFEGDPYSQGRFLRALKNRFGPTHELGVFQMQNEGLVEVSNPSELFVYNQGKQRVGSSTFCTLLGSRPLVCEIQSLVSPSVLPYPKRASVGMDLQKVHIYLAILQKYLHLDFSKFDVYLSLVGGLKISETSGDLGALISLYSARKHVAFDKPTVAMGEIGLTGEVRLISQMENRINECLKLGYKNFILPATFKDKNKKLSAKIPHVKWLSQAEDIAALNFQSLKYERSAQA